MGTYRVDGSINISATSDIDIICDSGAVIDGTMSTAPMLITIGGGLSGAAVPLSENAEKGTLSIVVSNASQFSAGDVIRILSTDLWNPSRQYYVRGELAIVKVVVGNEITVCAPLYDSYSSASSSVQKMRMPGCSIDSLKIVRGGGAVGGIQLQYLRNFKLRAMSVTRADERCIYVLQCLGGRIVDCETYGHFYDGSGTSYGLSIASSQGIRVINGTHTGGRHGIALGGTFPVRDFLASGTIVDNDDTSGMYCMDSHGNAEFCEWINCTVNNGAMLACVNSRVIGGVYRSAAFPKGALIFNPEVDSNYLDFIGVTALNYAGACAIGVGLCASGINVGRVNIDNVYAMAYRPDGGGYPAVMFIGPDDASYNGKISAISVRSSFAGIDANSTAKTMALAVGVYGSLTANLNVSDSVFSANGSNNRSISVSFSGVFRSARNTYIGADPGSYSGVILGVRFYSNDDTFDGAGTARYFYMSTAAAVKINRYVISNMNDLSGYSGMYIPSSTDVQLSDPQHINTKGSAVTVNSTHPYHSRTHANTRILNRTAPPTLGAWSVGDRCVNSAPSVGAPKSWVCTVAGSPGTWVSEGVL